MDLNYVIFMWITVALRLNCAILSCSAQKYESYSANTGEIPADIPYHVKEIVLQGHGLVTLRSGSFTSFYSLSKLDLSHNNITTIQPGAFPSYLEQLNLSNNQLSDTSAISDLKYSLNYLNLENNIFFRVTESSLGRLEALEYLYFGDNQIEEIAEDAFESFSSNLRYLDLSSNYLEVIEKDLFEGMTSLVTLYLDKNRLLEIPDFSRLPEDNVISVLALGNNQIRSTDSVSLKRLKRLQDISLNNNLLISFPELPDRETHLNRVNLDWNAITDSGLSREKIKSISLRILQLKGSRLTSIEPFYELKDTLEELYLHGNAFSTVTADELYDFIESFSLLRVFGVDYTSIEYFPDIRPLNRRFEELYILNHYTMICDCQLSWLEDTEFIEDALEYLDVRQDSLLCRMPGQEEVLSLGEIDFDALCANTRNPVAGNHPSGHSTSPRSLNANEEDSGHSTTPDYGGSGKRLSTTPKVTRPPEDNLPLVIGIVVGCCCALIIIVIVVIFLVVRRRRTGHRNDHMQQQRVSEPQPASVDESVYDEPDMRDSYDHSYTNLTRTTPMPAQTRVTQPSDGGVYEQPVADGPTSQDVYTSLQPSNPDPPPSRPPLTYDSAGYIKPVAATSTNDDGAYLEIVSSEQSNATQRQN